MSQGSVSHVVATPASSKKGENGSGMMRDGVLNVDVEEKKRGNRENLKKKEQRKK